MSTNRNIDLEEVANFYDPSKMSGLREVTDSFSNVRAVDVVRAFDEHNVWYNKRKLLKDHPPTRKQKKILYVYGENEDGKFTKQTEVSMITGLSESTVSRTLKVYYDENLPRKVICPPEKPGNTAYSKSIKQKVLERFLSRPTAGIGELKENTGMSPYEIMCLLDREGMLDIIPTKRILVEPMNHNTNLLHTAKLMMENPDKGRKWYAKQMDMSGMTVDRAKKLYFENGRPIFKHDEISDFLENPYQKRGNETADIYKSLENPTLKKIAEAKGVHEITYAGTIIRALQRCDDINLDKRSFLRESPLNGKQPEVVALASGGLPPERIVDIVELSEKYTEMLIDVYTDEDGEMIIPEGSNTPRYHIIGKKTDKDEMATILENLITQNGDTEDWIPAIVEVLRESDESTIDGMFDHLFTEVAG